MPILAVVLSVLAFPAAAIASFWLGSVGGRLAGVIRPDRVSRKDQRWLAGQLTD